MQSFKKIYSVVMKLNRFFALHVFANDLYIRHDLILDPIVALNLDFVSDTPHYALSSCICSSNLLQ